MSASGKPVFAMMTEQAGERTAWVHLIPAGTFNGVDGRGPYHLKDAQAVVTATRNHHGRKQIVMDYEHQSINSQQNGKPAPAAGWIVGLEAREDGIWGLVEWTETAAAHIAKREYRYISPVIYYTKDGTVTGLRSAALTNDPNLDQLVALNRAGEPMEPSALNAKLREAAALLGLPETADDMTVLNRVKQLVQVAADLSGLTGEPLVAAQSSKPDPAMYVPIGEYQRAIAEVNKLGLGIAEEKAKQLVSHHMAEGNIPPFMKDFAVTLCTRNLASFEEFVAGVGPSFNHLTKPSGASAMPPLPFAANRNHPAGSILSQEEVAICTNLGLTHEQYIKARPSADAWNME